MAYGSVSTPWKVAKIRLAANAKPKTVATKIVAASDSLDTTRADYICDGVADEVEINQALNALPSVSVGGGGSIGGYVHLLEGTYNISGRIVISRPNTTLRGSGSGSCPAGTPHGATHIKSTGIFESIYAYNMEGTKIMDLSIQGGHTSTYPEIGINLSFCNDSVISGCLVSNKAYGIRVYGGATPAYYNCLVTKNIVSFCDVYGITLQGVINSSVIDNHADNTAAALGAGITLQECEGCRVIGNSIDALNGALGTTQLGLFISDSENNIISGNRVMNNSSYGIVISAYVLSRNNTVTGNVSTDNILDGIRLSIMVGGALCQDNVVMGNRCFNNARYGISASAQTNRTVMVGNNVVGNTVLGMLDSAPDSEVAHNIVA